MLNSIYIGMTGLQGYSQGLRVIANNTANINTPGYKGSSLQFADMFYSNSGAGSGSGQMQVGYGLNTAGTVLNFEQGELRQTGNNLDLAIDGQGLFTTKDASGNLHYTRAGQFSFNADGVLVSRIDESKVMGLGADGAMGEVSITGLANSLGKATATVKFSGILSTRVATQTFPVTVLDQVGGSHALQLQLTLDPTVDGKWTVKLLDNGTALADSGTITFTSLGSLASTATVTIGYEPAGLAEFPLVLEFGTDVVAFDTAASTLAAVSQDGYMPGVMTGVSFDNLGTLVMAYSNGQTVKGSRLSLGRFDTLDAVESNGNNQFDATNSLAWHTGLAGEGGFGSVKSGMVELSNVDLSQEFSDLVIMQRGYQAASQVISTANDMLQELFQMTSK